MYQLSKQRKQPKEINFLKFSVVFLFFVLNTLQNYISTCGATSPLAPSVKKRNNYRYLFLSYQSYPTCFLFLESSSSPSDLITQRHRSITTYSADEFKHKTEGRKRKASLQISMSIVFNQTNYYLNAFQKNFKSPVQVQ